MNVKNNYRQHTANRNKINVLSLRKCAAFAAFSSEALGNIQKKPR